MTIATVRAAKVRMRVKSGDDRLMGGGGRTLRGESEGVASEGETEGDSERLSGLTAVDGGWSGEEADGSWVGAELADGAEAGDGVELAGGGLLCARHLPDCGLIGRRATARAATG